MEQVGSAQSSHRWRFGAGALLVYLLTVALVVGIGVLALVQLARISTTVDELTGDLAVQRGLAKDLVHQALLTRFYAQRYVRTQSQSDVDRFHQEFGRLEDLLVRAEAQIVDPERAEMLARIETAANDYERIFEELVTLIRNQQRINAEVLDIQEHAMRDKLTALRVHSVFVNDPSVFLAFGNAQSALERMRTSTLKFLVERDPKYAVEFDVAYQGAQAAFANLNAILEDPVQQENFVEAQRAAGLYHEGIDTIRQEQLRLNALLDEMENELEPQISAAASDIVSSVEQAYQSRNLTSKGLIARTRTVLILTTGIAIVTGLGLSGAIARRAAERRQAHEALQESERRYRTLFEGVPVGLYRASKDRVILDANPTLVAMLGFPSLEELRGTQIDDLYVDPRADCHWRQTMEDEGIVRSFEARLRRYDESSIWTRDTTRSVHNSDGSVRHFEGGFEDITEQRQAQAALEEAEEQLHRREKLAMLGQLAGGVAHELRNPLGVMSNAVYYLRMVHDEGEIASEEYLDILSQEVQNAEKIITDLLDFARIKSPSRGPVSVREIIDEAVTRSESSNGMAVDVQVPDQGPILFVDPKQMVQVVRNLITNARQAMPDGGRITIRARAEDAMVTISVSDTGTGMSKETLARLFEPLFTTKAKGIGLGLAISKHLVESNGGSISVWSEEGKGSTFTMMMPAADDHALG